MNPESKYETQTSTETGNKLVVVILGISFLMGAVLALTIVQMGISVHPSAMAAPPQIEKAEHAPASNVQARQNEEKVRINIPLKSFVVTLNEPGEPRYLKVSMSIELSDSHVENEIKERKAEIRDTLIPYLSSLSLRTTQGIRGKQKIRKEAAELINSVLKSGTVNRVFISEFITQ